MITFKRSLVLLACVSIAMTLSAQPAPPAPGPASEAQLLAALESSLSAVEGEAIATFTMRPGPETYREIIAILRAAIGSMRKDAMMPSPCKSPLVHCSDCKCGYVPMRVVICDPTWPRIPTGNAVRTELQMFGAITASMRFVETEAMGRFSHGPNAEMAEKLAGILGKALESIRKLE